MCKCLLRAGPKLSLAIFMLSMAAKNTALELDLRHFYKRMMLVFTRLATTELSSMSSLGSNNSA
jgi:hypothetical protein